MVPVNTCLKHTYKSNRTSGYYHRITNYFIVHYFTLHFYRAASKLLICTYGKYQVKRYVLLHDNH